MSQLSIDEILKTIEQLSAMLMVLRGQLQRAQAELEKGNEASNAH